MKKERKSYTAAFKAKVAIEAIKGQRTINEIASAFEVHPNQVTQWKKQAVSQLSEIFSNGRARDDAAEEELRNQLYQQIGQLKVELDWLKKKIWTVISRNGGNGSNPIISTSASHGNANWPVWRDRAITIRLKEKQRRISGSCGCWTKYIPAGPFMGFAAWLSNWRKQVSGSIPNGFVDCCV